MERKIITNPLKKTMLKGCFLLFLALFSTNLYAQITVDVKNQPLKEILKVIETKSEYRFFYNEGLKGLDKIASLQVKNASIDKTMSILLINTDINYKLDKNNLVVLVAKIKANQSEIKMISGVVTDENNEPIIGANISLKGSKVGTVTDIGGNFQISAQGNSTLIVSYIGYTTEEIILKSDKQLKITLVKNIKDLDEIVVIGYGSLKKGNITSSISSIKRENFIQGDISSPIDLVKGKVAGLMVSNISGDPTKDATGGVQIILRGVSNLSGNQQPLIVVDGIAGASLQAISPDDIESIDVLKDGSAAAIYGTRGNNGVIIVNTKQGAGGKKKMNVDYHGYTSYQTISNRIQTFNAEDFLKLPETTQGKALKAVTNLGATTDWFNEIYQTPINQNHNISVRGGDAASNIIMTVNYQELQGILKDSGKDQLQVRLAANQSLWNDKLRFYGSAVGTMVNSSYTNPSIYYNTLLTNPTAPIKNPTTGLYTFFQDASNPVQELNEKTTDTEWNRFSLNGRIAFEPIDNLNLTAIGSIERMQSIEGTFGSYEYFNGDTRHGEVWRNTKFDELKTFEFFGDYSLTVADIHKMTFLLGYSYQEHNWEGFSLYNYNFPTELESYNKPGLGLALKDGNGSMDGYKAQSKLISGFARVNYSLNDKYVASMSIRREGSTKFGVNNKWGMFPAVSVGWKISKESFLKNVKWVDELKVRAGYGVTGAEPSTPYLSINQYSYSNPVFSGGTWIWGVGPNINNNPDLRWETKKEFNIGVDYSFIKGRISGSIDLYNRRTDDLIYTYQVPVPPYLVSDIYANVGSISNSGIEILLSAIPVQKKNFVWNVSANISFNHNNLDKLSNDMYQRDFLEIGATGAPIQKTTHIVREGEPIGDFYGWKSTSISADGKNWLDTDGNPITMEMSKREVLGNGIPSILLGLSSSIKYKGLDASISLRGVGGFQILNQYRMLHETFMMGGNHNYPINILNKPYGVDTYAYTTPSYVSYYIENGDYLKIDNVALGYTFKFQKYVEKLRVYVSGLNLYTLTGYMGVDPEINMLGLSPGIDQIGSIYPSTRSFSFGVQLSLF